DLQRRSFGKPALGERRKRRRQDAIANRTLRGLLQNMLHMFFNSHDRPLTWYLSVPYIKGLGTIRYRRLNPQEFEVSSWQNPSSSHPPPAAGKARPAVTSLKCCW